MIPTFPEFKNLEWTDREEVEQFTGPFAPYSDFNFVSMWAWNTDEKMMLSQLYGNLVVLFFDYVTAEPFLSFIGNNELTGTAMLLLEYSRAKYQSPALKLVPEHVATNLCQSRVSVTPDADAHDYIIPVSYLCSLDSLPKSRRRAAEYCQKFLQLYPHYIAKKCAVGDCDKDGCVSLFKQWASTKDLDHWELNEYNAFLKFIHNNDCGNVIVSLHMEEEIMGFATYEIISEDYALCHFAKADLRYKGVYEALFFTIGKELQERNIRYWNFEQDLGLPGLRHAKRKLNPEFYLKKYTVELRA